MYKKPNFPEVDEFVICTVKEVQQHSVFLDLDEYEDKQGMLHTSEISRRLIRTMRVFFKPGRKIVCKVVFVDPEKKHINLSHRRVGTGQERSKQKEWNNEKRADDLLQVFAKQNKLDIKKVYKDIGFKIIDKYDAIFPIFLDIAKGDTKLLDKLIDKKLAEKLVALIQKRIIIPKAEIKGVLVISSQAPDGIEIIKKAIETAFEVGQDCELEIKYISAPKYSFCLRCEDGKQAEKAVEEIVSAVEKAVGKAGQVEFKR